MSEDDNKKIYLGFPKTGDMEICACGGVAHKIGEGFYCFNCCSKVHPQEPLEIKGGPVDELDPELRDILGGTKHGPDRN